MADAAAHKIRAAEIEAHNRAVEKCIGLIEPDDLNLKYRMKALKKDPKP